MVNFYFAIRITVGVVAGLRTVLTVECRYCYSYRATDLGHDEERRRRFLHPSLH